MTTAMFTFEISPHASDEEHERLARMLGGLGWEITRFQGWERADPETGLSTGEQLDDAGPVFRFTKSVADEHEGTREQEKATHAIRNLGYLI